MYKKISLLFFILSFVNLYALDTKYIPSESVAVLSINQKQVLKKLDKENINNVYEVLKFTFYNSDMGINLINSILTDSSGISKKDNVYTCVLDVYNNNLKNDNGFYYQYDDSIAGNIMATVFSLQDSAKFERFLIGSEPNAVMKSYQNYKVITATGTKDIVFFNDNVAIILSMDSSSTRSNFDYNYIADEIFSKNKKGDKKFNNIRKSKDDLFLFVDESVLNDIFIGSTTETNTDASKYIELSLNFNNNDITLNYNYYNSDTDFTNLFKAKKPFNKSLYKYANNENSFGFASVSMNIESYYMNMLGLLNYLYSENIFEMEIEEIGIKTDDVLEAFTGNIFVSAWEEQLNLDESIFEGMSEEDRATYFMLYMSNSFGFSGIFTIEIDNQEAYQKIIDRLVANGMFEKSSILNNSIYKTPLKYLEDYPDDYNEEILNANMMTLYQKDNILYVSTYSNIKSIIDGSFKQSKNIYSHNDKNILSLYLDIKNIINTTEAYYGADDEMYFSEIVYALDNLDVKSKIVNKNQLNFNAKLQLRNNESNSINWFLTLLINL